MTITESEPRHGFPLLATIAGFRVYDRGKHREPFLRLYLVAGSGKEGRRTGRYWLSWRTDLGRFGHDSNLTSLKRRYDHRKVEAALRQFFGDPTP